jgi:hypothetical protein
VAGTRSKAAGSSSQTAKQFQSAQLKKEKVEAAQGKTVATKKLQHQLQHQLQQEQLSRRRCSFFSRKMAELSQLASATNAQSKPKGRPQKSATQPVVGVKVKPERDILRRPSAHVHPGDDVD